VDEETEHTMRVTWKPAPGRVVNYRVIYRPQGGGRQMVAKVPPAVTSTVLKRLQPQTTYDIMVLPMYKTGEGKVRQGSGTTGTNNNNIIIFGREHMKCFKNTLIYILHL
jgi:collagen type XII alpha